MYPDIARRTAALGTLLLMLTPAVASQAPPPPLTLERAVALALAADDPSLSRFEARAQALEESAVAEAQLPDPMLSSQLANVPTDTFALDQADMTQLRLGVRQEFPAGSSRAARAAQQRRQADAERARQALERREIALATREAWFELAYQQRAIAIVEDSREAVRQQIDALAARFASGRSNAQAVLRAELELALLEDRLTEHRRQAAAARSALQRYLGGQAQAPLPPAWPALTAPAPLPDMLDALATHPAVAVETAQIAAADAAVDLAEEAYKPVWALEGGYGFRDDRPDFASVGVTVSLPLFTRNRQDRRHTAAMRQYSAEQLDRDAVLLELRRRLEQASNDWQRFDERRRLYANAVREHARQTARASINTYANGQTDFAELIRSQLAELDTALKHMELEARTGQAWARLVYLTGEPS
jgi:outer membrane protein TolC